MSAPIKTIYAPEHARMLKALTDEGAVLVYHRSGPTWNDGGAWHRIVARLTDGTHVSIKMESDYAPDVLIIEPLKQWPPMDERDARIADLERQLAEVREVKPLIWTHEARNGWKLGVAHAPGHHIMRRDDGWHYANGDGGVFPTLEAAKAAAQADYTARILSALKENP